MANPIPRCQAIKVYAFRGDSSPAYHLYFKRKLDDERHGRGPGPLSVECLLSFGHVSLSFNGGITKYGFHPDGTGLPTWQLVNDLKVGKAFPGVVRDDTAVFAAAAAHGLNVLSFDVFFPTPQYMAFVAALDAERRASQYTYGFPNGDGDCNCITWIERIGLPLLTGRMREFVSVFGIAMRLARKFGHCI
jgi:hypothetical protein